ncbi:MAG: transcriptional regulator [Rhizobiales bacterium]|nr:transcriptional regulator [Hyphomicrobiales bacterium]|tara:strand:+ start:10454 stop:10660 length:207 start_codon:yes stop_codon:yes gene_type:complete
MARAALKIGVRELADIAGVNAGTVNRYETEKGGLQAETRDKLQAALEARGVSFLPDNGEGAGVRLRRP